MRIEYSESGSVLIHLETIEDRIIFNTVHGFATNRSMTFDRIDSSTLISRIDHKIEITEPSVYRTISPIEITEPSVYRTISPEQNREIINAIKDRQKLLAVKMLKEFTGLGLKESKDAIDLFCDQNQALLQP